MDISIKNFEPLQSIESLKKISQSIAMLDAIICQEWEYRYYSFNSKWLDNEMIASMRDGQGSHYFILFFKEGAMIKGFDKDAPIISTLNKELWKKQIDHIPTQFTSFLKEPAFICDEATFFIWRLNCDSQWQMVNLNITIEDKEKYDLRYYDFDGSKRRIFILDGSPLTYKKWADNYFEGNFDIRFIEKIYEHDQLTKEIVESLNPDINYEILKEDIEEIGYPYDLDIVL